MAEAPASPAEDKNMIASSPGANNGSQRSMRDKIPPFYGLEAIERALHNIYPYKTGHAISPIISAPEKTIWCGGTYPLDFIKIFYNYGQDEPYVPPHWHYVTCGFSDLHGDERVHEFTGRGLQSGYGFELTIRVAKHDEEEPPTWPVALLNSLSFYVFNSDIEFHVFDHIPWPEPIDKPTDLESTRNVTSKMYSPSHISHMIIVEDPKIPFLDTPNGTVQFLQIVGIMKDEFRCARAFRTRMIIDQLVKCPQVSPLLLTDIERKTSVLDSNEEHSAWYLNEVDRDGILMGQVTSHICWKEPQDDEMADIIIMAQGEDVFTKFRKIGTLFLEFDSSSAELLHLMIKGRLLHGQTFVFRSTGCAQCCKKHVIEFIPHNAGFEIFKFVDEETPIRANDATSHLQIYCTKKFIEEMGEKFVCLEKITDALETLPMHIEVNLPRQNIHFSIYPELHGFKKKESADK